MTYDELQKALTHCREHRDFRACGPRPLRPDWAVLIDAAEAHLKTLPREVEVVRWAMCDRNGEYTGSCETEAGASYNRPVGGRYFKMTGKYTVQP